MDTFDLAIIAAFVVAYGVISKRITYTVLTGPMIFVVFGIVIGPSALNLVDLGIDDGSVRVLAEATLILLLFTDAARIDLTVLRRQVEFPARLLAIGLPLTIAGGFGVALWLLTDLGLWESALLAAILAPTDAALGQAVVTNRRIPGRIRQALNVESGLNDGIVLPVITLFLALAAVEGDLETPAFWVRFVLEQIGFGLAIGVLVGAAGGRIIDWASRREWMDGTFRQLATLAVAVLAFAAAEAAGGNGFVSAFVAGIAFGRTARDQCEGVTDFAEDEGQFLALLTFLVFGAAIAAPRLSELTPRVALYALASLTIVRIIPVAIAMFGTRLHARSVVFIGWFGPRGLASILFGLFILEEAALPAGDFILTTVTWTVLFSVLLHGASAAPLARIYGEFCTRMAAEEREPMPEDMPVAEIPSRFPME